MSYFSSFFNFLYPFLKVFLSVLQRYSIQHPSFYDILALNVCGLINHIYRQAYYTSKKANHFFQI